MSDRPPHLKPYALVDGMIPSAPLDLAERIDRVEKGLRALEWLVARRYVGTDFSGPLGLPIPKAQRFALYLHRTDRKYTASDAQDALRTVLQAQNMGYSALGAWLGEINEEVIAPTIRDTKAAVKSSMPWVLIGAGVAATLYLAPLMGRR